MGVVITLPYWFQNNLDPDTCAKVLIDQEKKTFFENLQICLAKLFREVPSTLKNRMSTKGDSKESATVTTRWEKNLD